MPAEGTTAAFDFCGNRHVPLAAQRKTKQILCL